MSDAEERMLLDDKNEDPTEGNSRCIEEVTNADLFSLLKTYMNDELKGIEKTFSATADSLAKKVRKTENSFKFKGNQIQFELNTDISEDVHSSIKFIVSDRKSKAVSILEGSITKLKKRNKLIPIADYSEGGWKTVEGYLSDEVASDSENEKRIRAADNRAVRKIKSVRNDGKVNRKRPAEAAGAPSQSVHNGGNFLMLRSPFVQSELSPQLRQTQRQMTSASDASLTDTGPVIAERRQTLVTKRSEFPEELLFKDANAEIFKVQRKENIESFDEYESGKTNIYVKGRLNNSFSFWENIGTSDFILSVNKDGYRIPLLNCPPKICLSNNKSSFEDSIFVEKAILDLLKGGLVKTVSNRPHVVNPLTVSFNGKGKERLILDLRHVNKHVRLDKFKFEDWKTLKQYVNLNN